MNRDVPELNVFYGLCQFYLVIRIDVNFIGVIPTLFPTIDGNENPLTICTNLDDSKVSTLLVWICFCKARMRTREFHGL